MAAISSPRWRMCGTYPRFRIALRAGSPVYALSAHRCCFGRAAGSGRSITTSSSVGSRSFTSCTFAPAATFDNGIPFASTSRLRWVPFFPPIRGVRANRLQRQRRFHHGAVDALPGPGDSLHVVVFSQALAPQADKEPRALPVAKVLVDGTGAAELLLGQSLPLAPGPQHLYNAGEYLPGGQGLPPAPWLPTVLAPSFPLALRNQRFHPRPQFVRHRPRFARFVGMHAQTLSHKPKINAIC